MEGALEEDNNKLLRIISTLNQISIAERTWEQRQIGRILHLQYRRNLRHLRRIRSMRLEEKHSNVQTRRFTQDDQGR